MFPVKIKLAIIIFGLGILGLTACRDEQYPMINNGTNTGGLTETDISDVRGYKDCYLGTFRCGLFVPRSYDESIEYPLIISLHGYSDTTTWNLEWYNDPLVHTNPSIVITPKCPTSEPEGWGDSWNAAVSPMMERTFQMFNKVDKYYNIDHNRIYIYGSSMGGYGTYAAIQQHPFLFAAAYVECGIGNTDLAGVLKSIPLWIFHGSNDPVVPVQGSRDMYHAILAAGGTQVRYTEYPGVQHNAWDYVKDESTLPYWLLAQRKESIHNPPEPVKNFQGNISSENHIILSWDIITGSENMDNNYWYCRIYRDNSVLTEIYNNTNEFIDVATDVNINHQYKISAVNYYFKESKISAPLSLDNISEF